MTVSLLHFLIVGFDWSVQKPIHCFNHTLDLVLLYGVKIEHLTVFHRTLSVLEHYFLGDRGAWSRRCAGNRKDGSLWLLHAPCRSVLEQDNQTQTAPWAPLRLHTTPTVLDGLNKCNVSHFGKAVSAE